MGTEVVKSPYSKHGVILLKTRRTLLGKDLQKSKLLRPSDYIRKTVKNGEKVLAFDNSKIISAIDTVSSITVIDVLNKISSWVWGLPLIILLLGTGVFLTIKLRFIQFRGLAKALKLAFIVREEKDAEGEINHFQALMTALAATVGTGNIVGVATAITAGGPGALFWMWVTGFVGMATKYAEAVLAVKYRKKETFKNAHGESVSEISGGPMYYITHGLKKKWLGIVFAVFAAIAAFGIGNMVQSNAVIKAVGISPVIGGIIITLLTGLVIIGGIKEIGKVTGVLVPFMISLYILGGLVIIILNIGKVPAAFLLIFKGAFSPMSAAGGVLGFTVMKAINKGVSRGIFSNESGLGSAPIAAAAAKTKHPVSQALVSMTQTFIDTIIVCTITGLVIIMSGLWTSVTGPELTQKAFGWGIGFGSHIVTIGITLFAFSTIIGWYYYGERSVHFLFGHKAIIPYKILWVGFVFVGAVSKLEFVWSFSDIMNGMMAIPNLIALLGLSAVIAFETKDFFKVKIPD
ncbi:MAG: sodium:alanine symporter family protein [Spirochaetes bacterium]|nr:sodium:alanine symporter family protein [Spirochaetota bacterium]